MEQASFGHWSSQWVKTWKGRTLLALAALQTAYAGVKAVGWDRLRQMGDEVAPFLSSLAFTIEAAALIGMVLFLPQLAPMKREPNEDSPVERTDLSATKDELNPSRVRAAIDSTIQFQERFRTLLLLWAVLYVALAINAFAQTVLVGATAATLAWVNTGSGLVLNVFENITTVAVISCYVVLNDYTVSDTKGNQPRLTAGKTKVMVAVVFVVVSFLVEAICDAVSLLRHGGVPQPLDLSHRFIDWSSSVASGISIALLVGRLESKNIGLSTRLVLPLYAYAVIQAAWPALHRDDPSLEPERLAFAVAALLFKVVLFMAVSWIIDTWRLLYYMHRSPLLLERVKLNHSRFFAEIERRWLDVPDSRLDNAVSSVAPNADL